jgi:hypothetical protein
VISPTISAPERDRDCPRCASSETLRAVVGMPALDLITAYRRGELALAGCSIFWGERPDWQCQECGLFF